MTSKLAFEALDCTLRDLTGKDLPMGGMCMLKCGDFRQILPVIQGGTRGNIVDPCFKMSFLWDHVIIKHLHTNMRVHCTFMHGDEAAGDHEFASQLLAIGDCKYPNPDIVQLPENIRAFVCSIYRLTDVYQICFVILYVCMAWLPFEFRRL